MKSYNVGDTVNFDFVGPDMSSGASGVVIFKNDEHIIVRHSCYTKLLAGDFNRKGLPYPDVEKITGTGIDSIREYEHDVFVDMMNPMTYLAESVFESGMYATDDIDWDLAIVGKELNGYTLIEADGKFNFIRTGCEECISDFWFDKALHFSVSDDEIHTFVMIDEDCFHLWEYNGTIMIHGQFPDSSIFEFNEFVNGGMSPEELEDMLYKQEWEGLTINYVEVDEEMNIVLEWSDEVDIEDCVTAGDENIAKLYVDDEGFHYEHLSSNGLFNMKTDYLYERDVRDLFMDYIFENGPQLMHIFATTIEPIKKKETNW